MERLVPTKKPKTKDRWRRFKEKKLFMKVVQSFADRLKRPMTEKIEFGFPYASGLTMQKFLVLDQSVK